MEAIVLAGGFGTRLKPVVPELPKPMAPIGGRPFLEHQLDYWIQQGVRRFVLSVGYKASVIKNHFGQRYCDADIAYVEEDKPLGTGGALLHAVPTLQGAGSFLALNGDTYFEAPVADMIHLHTAMDADWTVALRRVDHNARYSGIQLDDHGRIREFQKRGQPNASKLINAGVYMIHPRVLRQNTLASVRPLSLEDEMLPSLLADGARIYGCVGTGRFIDIGIPEDYEDAKRILSRGS